MHTYACTRYTCTWILKILKPSNCGVLTLYQRVKCLFIVHWPSYLNVSLLHTAHLVSNSLSNSQIILSLQNLIFCCLHKGVPTPHLSNAFNDLNAFISCDNTYHLMRYFYHTCYFNILQMLGMLFPLSGMSFPSIFCKIQIHPLHTAPSFPL